MKNSSKIVLQGIAIGLFASWVKSLAEPPLQEIGEKYFPPTSEELELKGADVNGQPENMPPAVLSKQVYHCYTDKNLSKKDTLKSMKYIHYGLGAFIGIVYAKIFSQQKKSFPLQGLATGSAVWLATHGSTVPELGLQGKVKDMPKSWWVWEYGSHLVFGVALEKSYKLIKKIIK